MIPHEYIEELTRRTDITELIGSYVQLKRKGRLYGGLCPFHSEKSPSFYVYPDTQSFYCFGCGAGGDVLTFAEKLFGLKPVDAAKRLDADFSLGLFASPAPADTGWQRRKAEREAAAVWREQRSWAIARCLKAIHDLPLPRPGDDDYAAHYALQQANAEWLEYAKEKEVLPD